MPRRVINVKAHATTLIEEYVFKQAIVDDRESRDPVAVVIEVLTEIMSWSKLNYDEIENIINCTSENTVGLSNKEIYLKAVDRMRLK